MAQPRRGRCIRALPPLRRRQYFAFIVVSEKFASAVAGVARVDDAGGRPHRPVRLYLRPAPRHWVARSLHKHDRIGPALPHGPLPFQTDSGALVGTDGDALDEAYNRFLRLAEAEVISLHAMGEAEARNMSGREHGPRFTWKPAVGSTMRRGANDDDAAVRSWSTVLAHAADLMRSCLSAPAVAPPPHPTSALVDAVSPAPPRPPPTRAAVAARRRLLHMLRCPDSDLPQVTSSVLRPWIAQFLDTSLAGDADCMRQLLTVARVESDAADRAVMMKHKCEWLHYIRGDSSAAQGRQHRYTRGGIG